MSNIRHTVVVRKDLNLPVGLLAAQTTHIAMEFIRDKIDAQLKVSEFSGMEKEWIKDPYVSVLGVNCSEDLDSIIDHAEAKNLPCHIWEDTIPSPTFPDRDIKICVGCSIGPADFDKIKVVTGAFNLY